MKLKSVLKKAVICGAFAVLLNYFTLPAGSFVASKFMKYNTRDKKIQQVCKTDEHLEDIIASIDANDCEALEVVKGSSCCNNKMAGL